MSDYTDLVERYIAAWNETDAERRRALIARTFTEGASYVDPIEAVQQRYAGYRFRRKGEVDGHNDRVRFSWELAPEGGAVFVDGTDFATGANDRLHSVTGFLDRQPGG